MKEFIQFSFSSTASFCNPPSIRSFLRISPPTATSPWLLRYLFPFSLHFRSSFARLSDLTEMYISSADVQLRRCRRDKGNRRRKNTPTMDAEPTPMSSKPSIPGFAENSSRRPQQRCFASLYSGV
eukprot:TRINITY_DN7133_c0_g1_i1.p2 TRINITY_DN7133_c0_g1~~TRINITY_DN7133_c0_g1_i1.p2  ORF type:complete len:125 (-),score=5.40 TRINITY_DN7133_c0_g1_i1:596-970(-)